MLLLETIDILIQTNDKQQDECPYDLDWKPRSVAGMFGVECGQVFRNMCRVKYGPAGLEAKRSHVR